jgi:hypothetical protein
MAVLMRDTLMFFVPLAAFGHEREAVRSPEAASARFIGKQGDPADDLRKSSSSCDAHHMS